MTYPLDRRGAPSHVDFGDLPTVPMDLYPQQDPKIPCGTVIQEFEVDSWADFVDLVEGQKVRGT